MRRPFALAISVLVLAGLQASAAEEIYSRQCLAGCPVGAPDGNELVIRDIYVLSNNPETKFADWIAYQVLPENIGSSQNRVWRADPWLSATSTLEPDDYRGANAALHTDRGHQAPLGSFTGTAHWRDTNYLSNITPQSSALNQGPWVRLETAVRALARQTTVAAVYVMTGPLYERQMPALPGADEPHRVPSGYWKIVAIQDGSTISATAFIFDQDTPRSANMCDHVETVDTVEQRSGLDFFQALPDAAETALERASSLTNELGCADGVAGVTATAQPRPSRSSNITSSAINVNTASYEELQQIIGVGPVIAQRIVEGRPFGSIGDLIRVRGIGQVTLDRMRPFVRVRD